MEVPLGPAPIDDAEEILRRIPLPKNRGQFIQENGLPTWQAFRPSSRDVDGLSVARRLLESPEQHAARGRSGKQYFIAGVLARELRATGAEPTPDPLPDHPGHALLKAINYVRYEGTEKRQVIQLCSDVASLVRSESMFGPFRGLSSIAD